jgi:phosphohistidine swiveling domain-containing protein
MVWKKYGTRQSDFWRNYMMISATGDIQKVFGCQIKERLTTRKGMIFIHWLNPEATWQCSLQIKKKILKDPHFINQWQKVFEKSRRQLLLISQQLKNQNFSSYSNQQLINFYDKFCRIYRELYPPFHLATYTDSIENQLRKWLLRQLKNNNQEEKFNDYFIKLSMVPKKSLLQEEELSLLAIALEVKKQKLDNQSLTRLLDNHTDKYAGLPVVNDESKPWDQSYFISRLKELIQKPLTELEKDYLKLKNYNLQVKKEQDIIFQELVTPELIKTLFIFIQEAAWVRLACRNTFAISHHESKNLFQELGWRHNLTIADIKWFIPLESRYLALYDKKPKAEQLTERKKVSVLLFRDGDYTIFEGKEAEKIIAQELKKEALIQKNKTLKGSIAYLGKVKGTAKIIFSQKDIEKMKKGDILIARMTTPELMPAIRKATAIVTDEGGSTCHASIIARELNIPCLVGTKYATEIFKDGDQIYVDAINGIVGFQK